MMVCAVTHGDASTYMVAVYDEWKGVVFMVTQWWWLRSIV